MIILNYSQKSYIFLNNKAVTRFFDRWFSMNNFIHAVFPRAKEICCADFISYYSVKWLLEEQEVRRRKEDGWKERKSEVDNVGKVESVGGGGQARGNKAAMLIVSSFRKWKLSEPSVASWPKARWILFPILACDSTLMNGMGLGALCFERVRAEIG